MDVQPLEGGFVGGGGNRVSEGGEEVLGENYTYTPR